MRYVLTILVAMLLALPASSPGFAEAGYAQAQQNDSGIFLAVKCSRGSAKQTALINHKQICLAQNPIILPAEFVSITEVQILGDKIWFDIVFSQKAVKTISQLAANLPSANFALVIQKDVFTTFPAGEITANRTFRFQGSGKDHPTFNEIQKRLKALIGTTTQ
ncbi:MAG: hypothetical protein WDO14_22725 [Bacteroidota bacterium]